MSKPRLLVSIRVRMETRYFRSSFPPLRASFQTLCEPFITSCRPPTPRMQVSSRSLSRENSTLFTLASGLPTVRDVHALNSPQLHTVPPHDHASGAQSPINGASSIRTAQDMTRMTDRSCSCPLSPKYYHSLTVFSLM